MTDKTFKGIMAGLEHAIAFAKGDASRGRVAASQDVKAIRRRPGVNAIEDGRRRPKGSAGTL